MRASTHSKQDAAPRVSIHDLVVDASAQTYRLSGHEAWANHLAVGSGFGEIPFDLVIPAFRRVEEVETAETIGNIDQNRLSKLREAGLEVRVLVPLADVGAAHARLRGHVDWIQPWWIENQKVHFGSPRLP